MNHFFNYHKTYMPQAKHLPYQPECTSGNPSPSEYRPNESTRSKNIKYSFDGAFQRFKDAARYFHRNAAILQGRQHTVASNNRVQIHSTQRVPFRRATGHTCATYSPNPQQTTTRYLGFYNNNDNFISYPSLIINIHAIIIDDRK